MEHLPNLSHLNNAALLTAMRSLAESDRRGLAEFLTHLMEVDRRKLYVEKYSSLFAYVTTELKYSESCAGKRIQAARLAQRWPQILSAIANGAQHLSGLCRMAAHLREDNIAVILQETQGQSLREIEKIIARHNRRPDVTDSIRRIPPRPNTSPLPLLTPTVKGPKTFTPLAPERVQIRFTGSEILRDKLERATALLSHKHPQGRLEDILEDALDALLAKIDPVQKRAEKPKGPQPESPTRYIPQSVRRKVWSRDQSQCAHRAQDGTRCGETRFLEIDHCIPFARGGSSCDSSNLRLVCRAHNELYARQIFGEEFMRRKANMPRRM